MVIEYAHPGINDTRFWKRLAIAAIAWAVFTTAATVWLATVIQVRDKSFFETYFKLTFKDPSVYHE